MKGFLLILMLPVLAHAEVMDKEFSLLTVWQWTLICTVASYLAARFRPWALILVLPMSAIFFLSQLAEVLDPYVGPAIVHEAGRRYVISSWIGPGIICAGAALGLLARKRRTPNHRIDRPATR